MSANQSTRGGARPGAGRPGTGRTQAQVQLRVSTAEKNKWVKAAKPGKLSEWIRDTLNKAAKMS